MSREQTISMRGHDREERVGRPFGGAASGGAVPCQITGAPTAGVYPVNVHANGKNETLTGTGELELLSVHIGEALESGDWVMGHRAALLITPGEDPEES